MKALYTLVGMKFFAAEAFVARLPAGEPLELVRELTNPHDPNAILVFARGTAIGYVGRGRDLESPDKYRPGRENEPLARHIDAHGKPDLLPGQEALRVTGKLVAGRPPKIEVEEEDI